MRVVYVSVDGKEFEHKEACLEWEKSNEECLRRSFEAIPQIKTDGERAFWGHSDYEVILIRPRNLEDITVINDFRTLINDHEDYIHNLTQDDIGKNIVLNFGFDRQYCDIYRVDSFVKEFNDTYNKFNEELDKLIG